MKKNDSIEVRRAKNGFMILTAQNMSSISTISPMSDIMVFESMDALHKFIDNHFDLEKN